MQHVIQLPTAVYNQFPFSLQSEVLANSLTSSKNSILLQGYRNYDRFDY